jgi:hypothetical protein
MARRRVHNLLRDVSGDKGEALGLFFTTSTSIQLVAMMRPFATAVIQRSANANSWSIGPKTAYWAPAKPVPVKGVRHALGQIRCHDHGGRDR